jgi:beta-phosphoglucomutase-like phosphatase (HAD superfamily)
MSASGTAGMPAGVLFDLDGVLLRSEEVWFRLVEEAGRRYRGTPITRREFAPTFGQGTEADVKGFRLSCTPAQLDRYYAENFQRFAGEVWVDPEARPTLEALAKRKVRRAVVTNTTTSLAGSLLARAELLDLVEMVACADQVARAKPEPDVLLHALKGLNIQPAARVDDRRLPVRPDGRRGRRGPVRGATDGRGGADRVAGAGGGPAGPAGVR